MDCKNCILVKEQLHAALLELKSARKIISLLHEGINKANASEAINLPKPSLPCGSHGYEQAGGKWIPAVHSFNKKKKITTISTMATEQSYMSSYRFTPLTNLNENQTDKVNLMSNCQCSSATNSMKKTTIQPSAGNKIPTIINGRVMNVETKKPSSTLKNSSRFPGNKINRYDHKWK